MSLDRPFDSAPALLGRSARLFFARLPFLATVTLAVFLPGKLLAQFLCWAMDLPPEGVASYLMMDFSDLVLGSLAIPAAIYGLTSGKAVVESLRYGQRLWGRMFWAKFKVEITVTLYALLLFIPGLIAMAKLALTDAIVAMEGEREPDPLGKSIELTAGRRWRVFFVVAPLALFDLIGSFFLLGAVPGAAHSRWMLAVVDSLWAVVGMWSTVAGLMMYLGTIPKRASEVAGPLRNARQRR
jgi:hypothetical protein